MNNFQPWFFPPSPKSFISKSQIFSKETINVIITIPYIANLLNKYKANKIDSNNLKRRIIILAILFIVIAIFEISYIKEFQIGLLQNVEKIKWCM